MSGVKYLRESHRPGKQLRTYYDDILFDFLLELKDYDYSTHVKGWISGYDKMSIYISNRRNKLPLDTPTVKYNIDRVFEFLKSKGLNPDIKSHNSNSINIYFDKP